MSFVSLVSVLARTRLIAPTLPVGPTAFQRDAAQANRHVVAMSGPLADHYPSVDQELGKLRFQLRLRKPGTGDDLLGEERPKRRPTEDIWDRRAGLLSHPSHRLPG